MNVEELGIDIWLLVASHLSIKDLCHLAQSSKQLYKVITDREIWINIAYDLSVDNDPLAKRIEKKAISEVDDPYQLVCKIFCVKCDVRKWIHRIISVLNHGSLKKYIMECDAFQAEFIGREDVVMHGLRELSTCHDGDDLSTLEFKSVAKRLMTSFRMSKLILTTKQLLAFPESEEKLSAEKIYWILAELDPSYDKLAQFRIEKLDAIETMIKCEFGSVSYFEKKPLIIKIEFLIKYITDVIFRNRMTGDSFDCEDMSISRVYSGEAFGSSLIKLSIIQELLSRHSIHSTLTQNFLTIKDNKNKHILYILTSNNNFPKVIFPQDMKLLIDRMYRIENQIVDKNEYVRNLLQPLNFIQILQAFLIEAKNERSHSAWNGQTATTPSGTTLKYTHSKEQITNSNFQLYHQAIYEFLTPRTKSLYHSNQYQQSSHLSHIILKLYPTCINDFFPLNCEESMLNLSNYYNLPKVKYFKDMKAVGHFYISPLTNALYCLIATGIELENEIYLYYIDLLGKLYKERAGNNFATLFEGADVLINNFIAMGSINNIGLYFQSYDVTQRKLIMTEAYQLWYSKNTVLN